MPKPVFKVLLVAVACASLPALAQQGGFYAGGSLGLLTANYRWTTTGLLIPQIPPISQPVIQDYRAAGLRGGVHGGWSHRFGERWSAGLELGFGLSPGVKKERHRIPGADFGPPLFTSEDDRIQVKALWDASLAARIGYEAAPGVTVYALAGPAWQNTQERVNCNASVFTSWCIAPHIETHRRTWSGWTAGAGAEWALSGKWLLRAEARFASFGGKAETYFAGAPADTVYADTKLKSTSLSVGLTYRF